MKLNRTQFLLLIACLCVIAMPGLAQTTANTTVIAAGTSSNALPDAASVETRTQAQPPPAAVSWDVQVKRWPRAREKPQRELRL